MSNEIYVLDLEMLVYNIDTKRIKLNELNLTYLWYYRLGHINEKHVYELHKNVFFDSFDYESSET